MKKILITLFFVLSFLGIHRAQAEVSLSFFYDGLQDEGDWFEADDYGYCWQPRDVPADWSPYTDGYWTYTDAGWTWVSYESFGWATYHYGRWADIRGRGWVWVPGYEWGPAWVSWRSNDDYIGWAPLPARAVVRVGVSIGRDVDYDYDIGPDYYRFTSCSRFGSPSLRGSYIDRSENVTIINRTTNITNITYVNNTVYNGGPDYDRVNRRSERPIERLRLDRITQLDNGRDNRFARRENGRLAVVAPAVVPVEERQRPRNVRANLGKVQTERGWSNVRDTKVAERTRSKIREENKGRERTPVNRGESVAQVLRSEARRKPVASVPEQSANLRPNRRPGAKDSEVKPPADRALKSSDPAPHQPTDRQKIARPTTPESAKPVNRDTANRRNPAEPATRSSDKSREKNADRADLENAARQREAAVRREKAAAEDRQNGDRQREQAAKQRSQATRENEKANADRQQASRQREQAARVREQASAQRDRSESRQREQAVNARREAALASRQREAAAARQESSRRADQQNQAEAARARAQRQQADVQREQSQRRQAAQVQPSRREVAPVQRESRPQARTQAQPSRERAPTPSKEERDDRKKRKSNDDGR